MQIVARYSFKNGEEFIRKHHKPELKEVEEIVSSVVASRLRTKISKDLFLSIYSIINDLFAR